MFSKLSNWFSSAFIRWLNHERPYEGIPLCDFERIQYEARPCDVLLIEGRSRVSDIIRSITQSSWSHAALYIGHLHDVEDPEIQALLAKHYQGPPNKQLVIEGIMGKGTIISPLSNYKKDHIRVCRPKGLSRMDAQQVISFAIRKLGSKYNVRQIFDLARFLLPWTILPRRLRSQLFEFQVDESTKTVCSSMIAEAFASVEFPILPLVKHNAEQELEFINRNPKLFTPRDFDYSPYFDIIKYPFVEFADYAMYRKLPWNRQGLVSNDGYGVESIDNVAKDSSAPKKVKKKKTGALKRLTDRLSYSTSNSTSDEMEETTTEATIENLNKQEPIETNKPLEKDNVVINLQTEDVNPKKVKTKKPDEAPESD